MRTVFPAIAALGIVFCSTGPAAALPGQTLAQFQAWGKSNTALRGLKKVTEEMSGLPAFLGKFTFGSTQGDFYAGAGGNGTISREILSIDGESETYDILKEPGVARAMVAAVYGARVANDFDHAKTVGVWTMHGQKTQTAVYRGAIYGYEAAHGFVELLSLGGVDAEVKSLKGCVAQDCGD